MDLVTALCIAVGAEASAIVALFWLNVRQRDRADQKFEAFYKEMLPLLQQFRALGDRQAKASEDMIAVVAKWDRRTNGP